MARSELLNYPLANDFEQMLEIFENPKLSEFCYSKDGDSNWSPKLL